MKEQFILEKEIYGLNDVPLDPCVLYREVWKDYFLPSSVIQLTDFILGS
jgi:hypothetical protein